MLTNATTDKLTIVGLPTTGQQQTATQDSNCIMHIKCFGTQALSTTKRNTMISTGIKLLSLFPNMYHTTVAYTHTHTCI